MKGHRVANLAILLVGIILVIFSAHAIVAKNGPEEKKYLILVGADSDPVYEKLTIGEKWGGAKTIMVFSQKPFGKIGVSWNKRKEEELTEGGNSMYGDKGDLLIRSEPQTHACLYVLQLNADGSRTLVIKKMIAEKSELKINLE